MKKIAVFCAMGAILAGFAAVAEDGVVITTAGEYPFTAGETYGAITNKAADGEVKLTSTGTATATDAISVEKFDATVSKANTTFSGGYWDFGATGSDTVNFFSAGQTFANRTTMLDNGAQVVGIGSLYLAGSSGTNNILALTGASSLTAAWLSMGSASANQRNRLTVSDGSSLVCKGPLYLSLSSVSSVAGGKNKTGNRLTVTGEGSSLKVTGTLNVGGQSPDSNLYGTSGGNTFEVADGASAALAGVVMGTGPRNGTCNRIVFSEGAKATMTSLTVASNVSGSYSIASNVIEILSGAVVTNSGSFTFGADNNKGGYNTCLVSNATFHTDKVYKMNTAYYFLRGPHSTFILSGENAKFTTNGGFDAFFKGDGCTFIVENGASYSFSNSTFSYTLAVNDETVLVRSGATVSVPSGFKPTGTGQTGGIYTGTNNAIVVESDAVLTTRNGPLSIYGNGNRLEVRDATVKAAGNKLMIGHDGAASGCYGTNCLLTVSGTRPEITATWSVYVWNSSKMRINLPASAYEAEHATAEHPLVYGATGIFFDNGGTLELAGAEEMYKYHFDNGIKGSYVLVAAGSGQTFRISEDNLAAIQATLPEGMTIAKRTVNKKPSVVLDVKPKFGMMFIVR